MSENHKAAPTCKVINSGLRYEGKQALNYGTGISFETTGAKHISMLLVTIKAGEKAKAHLHERHETAIYVMQGEASMWYGKDLKEHLTVKAGDFLYIPANVPHQPYNPSASQDVIAVIARTDPNDQESVVLLPHLEADHQP
jgi:uncharacterized RmlC-like cupin family protein